MPLNGTRTIKYELGSDVTAATIIELADQLRQQGVDARSRVTFDKSVGQRDGEHITVIIREPMVRLG